MFIFLDHIFITQLPKFLDGITINNAFYLVEVIHTDSKVYLF